MPKSAMVTIRFTADEKVRLLESARNRNDSVTGLIKRRLAPDIRGASNNKRRLPTKAQRKVLEDFIGMVQQGHTNESIDEFLYGNRRQ